MFTKRDENGAYIDVPDEDDLVDLRKQGNQYVYRIRGEAINKLARLEHLDLMLRLSDL